MYVRLNVPESVRIENDKELDAVSQHFKARKVQISSKQRERLDKEVQKRFDQHSGNTGELQQKLKEANEFLEGKPEVVDFPFGAGNSSTIDTRYASAQARTFVASFNRSVFSSPNLLIAETKPNIKKSIDIGLVESGMNWSIAHDCNAIDALRATPHADFRDGTTFIHGEWVRKIERGVDFKTYSTEEEFISDYPIAEDAGVTQEKFDEILAHLREPEAELHVEYELDFVSKNGPEYSQFSLANFIWGPLYAKDMEYMNLYGYRFTQSGTDFEVMVKRGYYDDGPAEKTRSKGMGPGKRSNWDASRDNIEGINTELSESASYEMAKLVVKADLDGDSIPEMYRVVWSIDSNCSLRVERYNVRRNIPCIIPWRLVRRGERFLGDSLLLGGMDLYKEVNALHRHRSNVRRLTDSVTLIAPASFKESVDLGAEYSEFKPGMTLWVPDQLMDPAKAPRQFVIQGTSRTNESVDEEQYIVRYLDGLVGISQGQSGRETAADPNAPGNKTAMLLMRADMRIEDYVGQWRESIPLFADLHRALLIQNQSKLQFTRTIGKSSESKELSVAEIGDMSLGFTLRAVKQGLDPATEMNKIAAIAAVALQFGIVNIKQDLIVELWNDYVIAARVSEPERYMIEISNGGMSMGGQPLNAGPEQLIQSMQQMALAKGGMNAANGGATQSRKGPSGKTPVSL